MWGAYPNKPDSLGYSACPDTATTLDRLLELGVVVRVADRWFFTQVGVSRLATAERLEHRRAVFEPRSDVSIMSSTPYELMLVMREEGWTWRLWTPTICKDQEVIANLRWLCTRASEGLVFDHRAISELHEMPFDGG